MATTKAKRARVRKSRARVLRLTAVYERASEGGYTVWVPEAIGVLTQGNTFEEAHENLLDAIQLMLEDAPEQFGVESAEPIPPGAIFQPIFVVLPG